MSRITININRQELSGFAGQTILEIAKQSGIAIPTLCYDVRVKATGACGLCIVEVEGMPRLVRSCATLAANGMIVNTNSRRVLDSRRTALELLLSDHDGDCRPPCVTACPAQTDCQGYVGLIANQEYKQAIKLIKDKIPLPGSIGRVCPHPCETACRRRLVEQPISIAALKAFAADQDMLQESPYQADIAPDTGKRVAVVGGGPGGLSAAYFLRLYGHGVTVYDAMPDMGGMLWYGIPEYRLPKAYLRREIAGIESMGIEMKRNTKVGRDISWDYLYKHFDAVVLAVGAWKSTSLRCPGEELQGVVGGIELLRDIALGKAVYTGRSVAIVGGGNTAMDACRTAVRLGAEKVYNIYRRTRDEMPAEEIEIIEAEDEGVIFKNLTNPIEIIEQEGHVKALRLQVMRLGEPDVSGRRAPVPVEGKEEMLEVDSVIVAIGQTLDKTGLDNFRLTDRHTIMADPSTFRTSRTGVFAIGDAINSGADIAITAIGHAKRAAAVIDRYLDGEEISYEPPYLVMSTVTAQDFADRKKQARVNMPHHTAAYRKQNFLEVNQGYTGQQAIEEAKRCLECGCHDYFECRLLEYANQYDVKPAKLAGATHRRNTKDTHPYIHHNPDKCILCGLCVRICDEVVGASALGLVHRGFDTVVQPAMGMPLKDTDCVSCGMCVHVCPTGALSETMMIAKQVPTQEQKTQTVCSFCSVGCKTCLTNDGTLLLRALPTAEHPQDALLCMKGRFGFGELAKIQRLTAPLIRMEDGHLAETTYKTALGELHKKIQSLQSQYGTHAVAVAVSDRYTSEEAFLIQQYIQKGLGLDHIYSFGVTDSGLKDVLGNDASTVDFDQMMQTDLILLVNTDLRKPHGVAGMKIRRAVKQGAKLIALNDFASPADQLAAYTLNPGTDLSLLKQMLKVLLSHVGQTSNLTGCAELLSSLVDAVEVTAAAEQLALTYLRAKKAVIVFEQNKLTVDAARLLANIALCAGKAYGVRNGIIQLKPGANTQGLVDLGALPGHWLESMLQHGYLKGLILFGEDPTWLDFKHLDFLAVQDLQLTDTAKRADLVLPAQSFAEIAGSYTNCVGKVQSLQPSVQSPVTKTNAEVISALSDLTGVSLPYGSIPDVSAELDRIRQRTSSPAQPRLCRTDQEKLARVPVQNSNALSVSLLAFAQKQGLAQ